MYLLKWLTFLVIAFGNIIKFLKTVIIELERNIRFSLSALWQTHLTIYTQTVDKICKTPF